MSRIYIVMPTRSAHPDAVRAAAHHVAAMEGSGHRVYFPFRDAPKDDPTGVRTYAANCHAMRECDEVHVLWDVDSREVHFELGIAYALVKPIKVVAALKVGALGKSVWKAVIEAADPDAQRAVEHAIG